MEDNSMDEPEDPLAVPEPLDLSIDSLFLETPYVPQGEHTLIL